MFKIEKEANKQSVAYTTPPTFRISPDDKPQPSISIVLGDGGIQSITVNPLTEVVPLLNANLIHADNFHPSLLVDPLKCDNQIVNVSEQTPSPSADLLHYDAPNVNVSPQLLSEIKEQHRMRNDFMNAEKRLTLQIKSICRRLIGCQVPPKKEDLTEADKLYKAVKDGNLEAHPKAMIAAGYLTPLMEVRESLRLAKMKPEKTLQKLAKQLPVWSWVEGVNGFGALGLAQIVAETGDLNNYANPAKLWKRLGLAVINGKSQRRVAGAEALEQGYSPMRRSMMFVLGDSLLKKQSYYRELYLSRKVYEENKLTEEDGGYKMIWHRRAQRYTEKRLLKHLWQHWRKQEIVD